jgi:hypothetical protein
MATKNNINTSNYVTAYIVRDENSRRFLTRPTYSGRVRGVWGKIEESNIFFSRRRAQSCASNINSRRPEGSAYYAQVRPVLLQR